RLRHHGRPGDVLDRRARPHRRALSRRDLAAPARRRDSRRRGVTMKWLAFAGGVVVLAAAAVGFRLAGAHDSANPGASGPPAGPYRGSRPPRGIHAPDFTLRHYRRRIVRMASLTGRVV